MIGDCWEVDRWAKAPFKIKIVSETEKTIIVETTDWHNRPMQSRRLKEPLFIFATREEAKAFMVQQAEGALVNAKRDVDRARSALETTKALKP